MPKRRDYASNMRKPYDRRSGCARCGAPGFGRIPEQPEYCSDACLQADMEGIDDLPPVTPLSHGRAMSARPWQSHEDRLRNG